MCLSDKYHSFFTHFLDFLHESIDFCEIILYLLDALGLFYGMLVVILITPLINLMLKLDDIVQYK